MSKVAEKQKLSQAEKLYYELKRLFDFKLNPDDQPVLILLSELRKDYNDIVLCCLYNCLNESYFDRTLSQSRDFREFVKEIIEMEGLNLDNNTPYAFCSPDFRFYTDFPKRMKIIGIEK